jgi:hypothetical protein
VPDFSAGNALAPIVVRTDVGDNYFHDGSAPRITVLKIDVEGGERGVLEGLRETLLRCRPAVVLELSEHTRNDIGSLDRLYSLLYPGAVAFTVEYVAAHVGYKLHKCDFRAPSDILIVPSALSAAIPSTASFASVPANPAPSDHHGSLLRASS